MDRVGLVAQVAAWSVLLVLAGCDDGGGPVGSPPTFTELATGLTGVDECSLAWGDADNDGDLDLAVAGDAGSAYVTKVYETRNGQLDAAWELATGLPGVAYCSLAWAFISASSGWMSNSSIRDSSLIPVGLPRDWVK